MHIVFVYTEAEMHILHIIQLILLFPRLWVRLNGKGGQNYPTLPYFMMKKTGSLTGDDLELIVFYQGLCTTGHATYSGCINTTAVKHCYSTQTCVPIEQLQLDFESHVF